MSRHPWGRLTFKRLRERGPAPRRDGTCSDESSCVNKSVGCEMGLNSRSLDLTDPRRRHFSSLPLGDNDDQYDTNDQGNEAYDGIIFRLAASLS